MDLALSTTSQRILMVIKWLEYIGELYYDMANNGLQERTKIGQCNRTRTQNIGIFFVLCQLDWASQLPDENLFGVLQRKQIKNIMQLLRQFLLL